MTLPGRHIQVESVGLQIAAIPVIAGCAELILQPPLAATEISKRQSDAALALVGRIVHSHQ
jgi:hypothetical protein